MRDGEGGLTDVVDVLTVGRGIRTIDTSPDTEVVYSSALFHAERENGTYWKT